MAPILKKYRIVALNMGCLSFQHATGWEPSDRGVSYRFGPDVVESFLSKNNLSLVVRAHQVVEDGYEFFHQRSLVTLFSAPNYCGKFDNAGAIMQVKEDLTCSFSILPVSKPKENMAFLRCQWVMKALDGFCLW